MSSHGWVAHPSRPVSDDPRIGRLVALRDRGLLTPAEAKALRMAAVERQAKRQARLLDTLVAALGQRGVTLLSR